MDSEGLKQFLKVVADAVYNLNTICVGLDVVAKGDVTKSEHLTIIGDADFKALFKDRYEVLKGL